jgi:hypothetical protein
LRLDGDSIRNRLDDGTLQVTSSLEGSRPLVWTEGHARSPRPHEGLAPRPALST